MKITKEIKNTAAELFASTIEGDVLLVNSKGNFFTNKNRAELSDKKKNIAIINRSDVAELIEAIVKSKPAANKLADEAKEKSEKEAKEKTEKEAKEKSEKEAKEQAEKEAKLPSIEELKAMGDKLPEYLNSLKRDALFDISELLEVKIAGNLKNADFAAKLLELLTKEA